MTLAIKVWFANPRDPSTWGEIQSQYDADVMNVHEKVTELRREIREMHEKMLEKHQARCLAVPNTVVCAAARTVC